MAGISKWFKGKKKEALPEIEEATEDSLVEQDSAEQFYGLPPVHEGQVTINDTGVSPADGSLLVSFFISNGLKQKLKFENVPLVLLGSEKQVMARQVFDGTVIGEIASGTAKACVVRFDSNNVYDEDISEGCQVCFDVPAKRPKIVEISYQAYPENITEAQRQELEQILSGLPPIKYGELNFSALQAQLTPQNELLTTVIIRNATDKSLNLEKIPLAFYGADHQELVRGHFKIDNLVLKPFKALLWTFNFGSVELNKDTDLSTWDLNIAR